MGQLIKVAEANDVPPGTAKAVEAEGRRIALFNSGGGYFDELADRSGRRHGCFSSALPGSVDPSFGSAPNRIALDDTAVEHPAGCREARFLRSGVRCRILTLPGWGSGTAPGV